ncbi:MAG: hypothetical protein HY512_01580 [Candidatus Aenigmarchaeota archaeon]|nr:hypothetical protein [Candidatus Aenigmarchaeota archaeon]
MKTKYLLPILILIAVVLVSGCAQKTVIKSPSSSSTQTPAAPTATSTPSPTTASISSELITSDELEAEASDPDFDNLNSDLGEVESGL